MHATLPANLAPVSAVRIDSELRCPVHASRPRSCQSAVVPPAESGLSCHVLIADNDAAVSSLLTEVLVRLGLQVRHAFDGEVARRMARDPAVGVLICDLDMPRLSGLEVLESLASLSRPPQAIVVSGYLDAAVQDRLVGLPYVRELLRKPFDLLEFAERVSAMAASFDRVQGGVSWAEDSEAAGG